MLRVTAITHQGLVRSTNQDRVVAGRWVLGGDRSDPVEVDVLDGATVAVVDGMGGAAGGHIAASLAAGVLASAWPDSSGAIEAVHRANQVLYETAEHIPSLAGMGATVAGVSVGPDDAAIFNVGDARVYVEVDGELIPTSVDDASASQPGAVTASLGGLASFEPVTPHVFRELSASRRFLVASDGLTRLVDHNGLHRAVTGETDRTAVCRLLELTLELGAPDNVSIAIIRLLGEDA